MSQNHKQGVKSGIRSIFNKRSLRSWRAPDTSSTTCGAVLPSISCYGSSKAAAVIDRGGGGTDAGRSIVTTTESFFLREILVLRVLLIETKLKSLLSTTRKKREKRKTKPKSSTQPLTRQPHRPRPLNLIDGCASDQIYHWKQQVEVIHGRERTEKVHADAVSYARAQTDHSHWSRSIVARDPKVLAFLLLFDEIQKRRYLSTCKHTTKYKSVGSSKKLYASSF